MEVEGGGVQSITVGNKLLEVMVDAGRPLMLRDIAAGVRWDLHRAYEEAMAQMKPKYGHWVIFEHCMPFDLSRTYGEAKGLDRPQIWTADHDVEMRKALEGGQPMKSIELHD